MNGSTTALADSVEDTLSTPRILGSSIGSMSTSRKALSEISSVYKEARNLFLTRRLPEALSTIEPLITASHHQEEDGERDGETRPAPIAVASRSSRIKVWNFYLTLLNAIAELGLEDGRAAFGVKTWKNLVAKAQNGTVWEEVVDVGYGGIEGRVDADVVINLATLLLAQSPTQKVNQERLESYLSASNDLSQDLTDRFKASDSNNGHVNDRSSQNNGTNTPRDLNTRVKIVELFTLHVLPRNGEWDYAKGFINNSEVLDEEIRDSFLQALQSLEDEDVKSQDQFEDALPQQNGSIEYEPQPAEDTDRTSIDTVRHLHSTSHHRSESETDYGIDGAKPSPAASTTRPQPSNHILRPAKAIQSRPSHSSSSNYPRKPPTTGIYKRSLALMSAFQHMISNMTNQISQNPMGLLRFVMFLMGLIVALSRRDVKDRLGRLTGAGWDKIKRTVGMGVKVSYI